MCQTAQCNDWHFMPFSEAIKKDKPPDKSLIKVLDELCI